MDEQFDLVKEVWRLERERVAVQDEIENVLDFASRGLALGVDTATINPYASLPMFLDFSHWSGTAIDWASLKADPHVIGVAHKLGEVSDAQDTGDAWNDSAFQTNFGGSAGAGIPSLAYFFDDGGAWALNHNWVMDEDKYTPIWNDPKLRVIIRQLAYGPQWVQDSSIPGGQRLVVNGWRPFRAIVIDIERHWQSYSQYYAYLKGETTSYTKLSGPWINFSVSLLIDRLQYMMNRGMMKRVPIMVYTRKSFVDDYSPQLATTLSNREDVLKWAAHYVVGSGNVSTTIDGIYANYLPHATFSHREIYGPSTLWQWSGDRYRIPQNGSAAVDLNFFMGTREKFAELFGVVTDPVTPPEPPAPPVGDYVTHAELAEIVEALEAQGDALEKLINWAKTIKGYEG